VSSKLGHLSVLYIQQMNIITVDFIKIISKNLVIKQIHDWLYACIIFHQKSKIFKKMIYFRR